MRRERTTGRGRAGHSATAVEREADTAPVRLLAGGRTAKEVAAVIGMSSHTAEAQEYQSMKVLGLTTTAELIREAIETASVGPKIASP